MSSRKKFHHCGRIYTNLSGKGVPQHHIHNWDADTEHGLFHGLSAAIIATLILKDEIDHIKELISIGGEHLLIKEKNLSTRHVSQDIATIIDPRNYSTYKSKHADLPLSYEGVVASCLLHDFLKVNGHPQERHDSDLRNVFPNLEEAAYYHASPPHHHHPLLKADVIELRRYSDHLNWYRPEQVEGDLCKSQERILKCYYDTIRPALETAYINRDQPWIRHGPEVEHNMKDSRYPQHPNEWVAVEIDRLPFGHCFDHDHDQTSAPWSLIRGIISLKDFGEKGGAAKPHMESYRDHLFAKCHTNFEDWIFVIDNRASPHQKWASAMVDDLIERKCKVVERQVLNKFIHICHMITDRLKIMNLGIDTSE